MARTKYSEDYERVWKMWPGRWNQVNQTRIKVGKYEAYLIWKKLDDEDKADIEKAIPKVKGAGTLYLKDFNRWLKERKWEDFL